jgi:hypothetical protein
VVPRETTSEHTEVPSGGRSGRRTGRIPTWLPASRPADARRLAPLSLAVVLVPASLALMRFLIGLHRPFAHAGDAAILETAIRRVATGTQALGPYSRFGFHQPGPAYFFLQAPFSWLTGGSPRSLFIGALVINLGAAAACIAVVRRQFGEPAARWSAVVIAGYLLAVSPALLADPWNPYVLGTPLLLTILLAARAAAGSWSAAAGAAVVGTFVVQTHLGTAVTLLALFGVTAVIAVAGRQRRTCDRSAHPASGHRRWAVVGAAAVLLGAFWIPPVVEQVTHSPGNATLIARFFRESHPEFDAAVDHSLGTAATQVAAHLATLPLGRPFDEPADPGGTERDATRTALALAGIVAGGVVAVLGWRRRHLFVATLGGLSIVGSTTAIWSTTQIVGEAHPYLLVWTGSLLLPAWMAIGLVGRRLTDTLRWRQLLTVTLLVVGTTLTWSMVRAPLPPVGGNPDVAAATAMTRPWLRVQGGPVRVRIGQHDLWPVAVGLVNELDRHGVDVTVDEQWAALFGDQFAPTNRERSELWLTAPTAPAPAAAAQRLGTAAGASLWGRLTSPSTR